MAAVIALATVAGSLTSAAADDTPVPPPCARVGVIGDSLSEQSRYALRAALGAVGIEQARIDGSIGRTVRPIPHLPSATGGLGRLQAAGFEEGCFIVELGLNDARFGYPITEFAENITNVLEFIGDRRVLWVSPGSRHVSTKRVSAFHDALVQVAANHPLLTVVDWAPQVEAHPRWAGRDGIHLTPSGVAGFSAFIADAALASLFDGVGVPAPPADCVVRVGLRMGSAGPDVMCLERRLAQLGFTIAPDTAFRHDTQTALLQFEFYENLPQIGAVDNRTRKALGLVPA